MPILKNPKHELFAQGMAKGESGRTAYRAAGYTATDAACDMAASRLMKTDKVSARVVELQGRSAEKAVMTKAWILEELRANAEEARAAGQYGPANRAYELIGREGGMFVERKEIGGPGDFDSEEDAVLRDRYNDLAREVGRSHKNSRGIEAASDQAGMRGEPSRVH